MKNAVLLKSDAIVSLYPETVIKDSPGKGRGIFAVDFIPKGTVIEVSPVIVLKPPVDTRNLEETILNKYVFEWLEAHESDLGESYYAIALGKGSLFNHNTSPNASFENDFSNYTIVYKALRDIPAGDEILIDYQYDPLA